jgi:hypothetical protein
MTGKRKWTAIIGPLVGIGIFLFAVAEYWTPLLTPFLPDHRVERPAAGFAISFPADWETTDAAEAIPGDWWDAEQVDDVDAHHDEQVVGGLLQIARQRSPLGQLEFCELFDWTGFAAIEPEWADLEDAGSSLIGRQLADPSVIASDAAYLELPAGRTLTVDTGRQDGLKVRDYVYLDGKTWFYLACYARGKPVEDRWLSIAETFEFLPGAE